MTSASLMPARHPYLTVTKPLKPLLLCEYASFVWPQHDARGPLSNVFSNDREAVMGRHWGPADHTRHQEFQL